MGRKTILWTFQAINKGIEHKVRNGISSHGSRKQSHKEYGKARIDKKQQNSRYRLCVETKRLFT